MSDTYLRIVPDDPKFVPSPQSERIAVGLLLALNPGKSVTATRSDEVQFVDAGGNFGWVLCPNCRADLSSSWPSLMDDAWKSRFSDLALETPCCRTSADLNRLVYEWPTGFAQFVLEVSGVGAGQFLSDFEAERVGDVLGCPVRQILSRY